jgi:hypothetical protein
MDISLQDCVFIGIMDHTNMEDLPVGQIWNISKESACIMDIEDVSESLLDDLRYIMRELAEENTKKEDMICVDYAVMFERFVAAFNAVTHQKITIEKKKQWKMKIGSVTILGAINGFEGPLNESYAAFAFLDAMVELYNNHQIPEKSSKSNFDQYKVLRNAVRAACKTLSEQDYCPDTDLEFDNLLLKNVIPSQKETESVSFSKKRTFASIEPEPIGCSLDDLIVMAGISAKSTITRLKLPHLREFDLNSTKMIAFDDMLKCLGIHGALIREEVVLNGELVETLEFVVTNAHNKQFNQAVCDAIVNAVKNQEKVVPTKIETPVKSERKRLRSCHSYGKSTNQSISPKAPFDYLNEGLSKLHSFTYDGCTIDW